MAGDCFTFDKEKNRLRIDYAGCGCCGDFEALSLNDNTHTKEQAESFYDALAAHIAELKEELALAEAVLKDRYIPKVTLKPLLKGEEVKCGNCGRVFGHLKKQVNFQEYIEKINVDYLISDKHPEEDKWRDVLLCRYCGAHQTFKHVGNK
jgi:hypothetical protein